MMRYMTKSIENKTLEKGKKLISGNVDELYFKKIQKNTDNSLNSGNFCLILQTELCLIDSLLD